jgi:hypothetical protein
MAEKMMGGMFGGGGDKNKMVMKPIVPGPQERRDLFLDNYMKAFGDNAGFKDSLQGFYGGQDLATIGEKLSHLNTFQGRATPKFRYVPTTSKDNGGSFLNKVVPEMNLF